MRPNVPMGTKDDPGGRVSTDAVGGDSRRLTCLYPFSVYALFLTAYALLFDAPIWHGLRGAEGLWQFLPGKVLLRHPFESLLYLHSRPPLGNALYALDLHFRLGGRAFLLWNLAAGALLFHFVFRFIERLCGDSRLAVLLFALVIALLSLNILAFLSDVLYTFSTAGLVVGVSWFAFDYLGAGRTPALVGFMLLASTLSLLRESYGPAFLSLLIALFVVCRGRSGLYAIYCLGPAILWSGKNLLVFGFFGMSTWLGQTLFLNAGPSTYLPSNVRHSGEWARIEAVVEHQDPRLGALFVGIAHRPSDYEARGFRFARDPRLTDIPALARDEGSWWGASNKNAYEYIELSAAFMTLSLKLIRERPMNYLANCWTGFRLFLKPSWTHLQTVTGWHNTHPHLFARYRLPPIDQPMLYEKGIFVSEGYDLFPLAYAVAIGFLLFRMHSPTIGLERAQAAVLLVVIAIGSASAFMVSNVESMRYKFEIEPLVYSVFFGWLGSALNRVRARRRGAVIAEQPAALTTTVQPS